MYESGVIVALLIWAWQSVNLLILVNSRMERNLNRVGQRFSWIHLQPKNMNRPEKGGPLYISAAKYIFIVLFQLMFVALSWLQVFAFAVMVAHRITKDAGAPPEVKELRWKLRNQEMSFEQIVQAGMKATGQPPERLEQAKQELADNMRERGLPV